MMTTKIEGTEAGKTKKENKPIKATLSVIIMAQ